MEADFTWRWLATPYVAVSIMLAVLGTYVAVVRGDRVMRLGILGMVASCLIWSTTFVLAECSTSPVAAEKLLRVGLGPIAMVGPGILLLLLGGTGRLEQHRRIVVAALLLAAVLVVVCWATPWTLESTRVLSSGLIYVRGGPLLVPHSAQLAVWIFVGLWIARQGVKPGPRRRLRPFVYAAVLGVMAASLHDALLSNEIIDGYPVAAPAMFLVAGVTLWQIHRRDLLRSRGFDDGVAIELLLMVAGVVVTMLVVAVMVGHANALAIAAATAPVPVASTALAIVWRGARSRRRAEQLGTLPNTRATSVALTVLSEAALSSQVRMGWLEAGPVVDIGLWLVDGALLRAVDGSATQPLDLEAARYLVRSPNLIVAGDLSTTRLGAARAPLDTLIERSGPDVIWPLVDGDQLLGVIGARRRTGQAVHTRERERLAEIGAAASRALTYLRRTREAEVAADAKRELEIAEASRAQLAERSGVVLTGFQLTVASRPAAGLALEAWAWESLDEHRLALFVADVGGGGVPAALLSSALVGAFTAATRSPVSSNSSVSLARELHVAISQIAPRSKAAAFVAILDGRSGRLDWTNAGHRGGTLVRRGAGTGASAFRTGGESSRLGSERLDLATGAITVEPDQMLVVLSEGALTARDGRGRPWGEGRLGKAIESLGEPDETFDPSARVLEAIMLYVGNTPLRDDVLVLTVSPLIRD